VLDLRTHHVPDRALREALLPQRGEGVVEIRADLPLRAGVLERVARGALLEEETASLAGARVLDVARGAAAHGPEPDGRDGRDGCERDGDAAAHDPVSAPSGNAALVLGREHQATGRTHPKARLDALSRERVGCGAV
jgi:hypothetical protein